MKVIQNKFIPFKGYKYINLFGLIFTRDKSKITNVEYNHEKNTFKTNVGNALDILLHLVYFRMLYYLDFKTV